MDLLTILEEYFASQTNIDGDNNDINTNIERYETCYRQLRFLLRDLEEMGEQANGNFPLPERWESKFDEYFNGCITAYIMNSDNKSDLSEKNAVQYMPYEYTYCSKCGTRCYYGAYPNAIENNHRVICELCFDEE